MYDILRLLMKSNDTFASQCSDHERENETLPHLSTIHSSRIRVMKIEQ